MASIFSKIVAGEIPAYKVAEDDNFLAFLDISPLRPGHTLVIPKRETDYYFDIQDDELAAMNVFAKKVAHAIKKAVPCKRIGVVVIGLEVPHAHMHLIPMNEMKDVSFTEPKLTLPSEEMERISKSIASFL